MDLQTGNGLNRLILTRHHEKFGPWFLELLTYIKLQLTTSISVLLCEFPTGENSERNSSLQVLSPLTIYNWHPQNMVQVGTYLGNLFKMCLVNLKRGFSYLFFFRHLVKIS